MGGTINETTTCSTVNVKRYGGIFVPPTGRCCTSTCGEMMAGWKMILEARTATPATGSQNHGHQGEAAAGVAKQLYTPTTLKAPTGDRRVACGEAGPGVGPMDVALTLVGATFDGFNKNTKFWNLWVPAWWQPVRGVPRWASM